MALNTKIRGLQIADAFFGAGLKRNGSNGNIAEVSVDNSSIEITSGDALQVKALGITNDMLAGSIADGKLAEDYVKVSEIDGSSLEVTSAGVVQIKNGGVTNDMLAGSIADGKLVEDYVKVSEIDGSTLEVTSAGVVQIKNAGVTDAKLAEDYVKVSEIDGVTLEVTSGGDVQIKDEGVTEAKLDVYNSPSTGKVLGYTSNGLEWVTQTVTDAIVEGDIAVENESANCNGSTVDFTLSGTPVTNSVQVFLNGLLQESGSGKDYTLSGTTVSFATAPITGDILIIHYVTNN